jgi:hypothetical protein
MCKHVISLAIELKYVKYPTLDLYIEGKRKQGRPRLAKPALERQDDDNLIQDTTIENIDKHIEDESLEEETTIENIDKNKNVPRNIPVCKIPRKSSRLMSK